MASQLVTEHKQLHVLYFIWKLLLRQSMMIHLTELLVFEIMGNVGYVLSCFSNSDREN